MYGPYICNQCGSCCSQKSLERKFIELENRQMPTQAGLAWKVEKKVGHLERSEIFCYKCGNEMLNNEKEYRAFLDLLEHPDGTFAILKKGVNKYGFWYLIRADDDFFARARAVGLRISPTKGGDPQLQFVSKGQSDYLVCQHCHTKYNKTKAEFVKDADITLEA